MRDAPPFSTWLISAGLIACILGALQWTGSRYQHEREQAFQQSQQQRIHDYLDNTESPRIVMLGNSLMRAATPFKALPTEPPLPWLRIYHATDDFTPFMTLWPDLLRNPPDLLIVHAELLLPRPGRTERAQRNNPLDNLHDWKTLANTWRMNTMDRQQHYRNLANKYQLLKNKNCGKSKPSWASTQRKMQKRRHRYQQNPAITQEAYQHIAQAALHIPRVVLLDIPRSQSVEYHFGDDTAAWLETLQQELSASPNITLMRLGEALPDSCYCDYRHMKPACQPQQTASLQQLATQAHRLN